MRTDVQLIQCQVEILKAMLLCGELVEHDAKWLKNAKTVVRDGSGRFASKAASIKEDVGSIAKSGGDILSISADAIGQMVKDPGFRERAGLGASAMMGKAIGNLVAQAKIFPGLEKEIDKLIQEQEKKLQDIYGKDDNALTQALRKTKLPEPPKDASFKEKLEFQAARYKAYEDTLKNPEYRTTLDEIAAVGKASVPLAVGLGLNLAVDLAIPFLLGNPLSLGALVAASVASYAASEGASFAAQKLMDKSGLNKTQKMVVDVAVRVFAGGAVSGAASKAVGKMAAKKVAEETAVKASKQAVWDNANKGVKQEIKRILKFGPKPLERGKGVTAVAARSEVGIVSQTQVVELQNEELNSISRYVLDSSDYNSLLRGKPSPNGLYNTEAQKEFYAKAGYYEAPYLYVTQELPEKVATLVSGLQRLPPLKTKEPLFRAVHNFPAIDALKPGDVFHDPGLMSASIPKPKGAISIEKGVVGFDPDDYAVRLVIKTKNGGVSHAKDISLCGGAPDEALYPPGMKFKVVEVKGVSKPGSKTVKEIHLEEVGVEM